MICWMLRDGGNVERRELVNPKVLSYPTTRERDKRRHSHRGECVEDSAHRDVHTYGTEFMRNRPGAVSGMGEERRNGNRMAG